ncbi:MAG: hypothetical protein HY042_04535, partial [Spirochaetia bacterium]|nr:hypothetical protein [Spirochaetia bacterium]
MVVLGNAQSLQAYQKLLENLTEEINRQNRAIENQTASAAASAGFVRMGSRYVKTGSTLGATGVVDAYTWYDAVGGVNRAMSESGFSMKAGADLVKFLESAGDIEVQSYFRTQTLEAELALKRVLGTGSEEERQRAGANDSVLLGYFGAWAGRGPSAGAASAVDYATNNFAGTLGAAAQNPYFSAASTAFLGGGFGELGAVGARPSGIQLGFYSQLSLMGQYVAHTSALDTLHNASQLDPVSAAVGQTDFSAAGANAYWEMKTGHDLHGYQSGNIANAEWQSFAKGAVSGLGMAGSLATAGWSVNTQTGSTAYDLQNDRTRDSIAGSLALGPSSSLYSAGYSYNVDGSRDNNAWTLHGKDQAVLGWTIATVASAVPLAGGAVGRVGSAYASRGLYGDERSGYAQVSNGLTMEGAGSLAVGLLLAGADSAPPGSTLQNLASIAKVLNGLIEKLTLQGLMDGSGVEGLEAVAALMKDAASLGGLTERLGNWFRGNGFEVNDVVRAQLMTRSVTEQMLAASRQAQQGGQRNEAANVLLGAARREELDAVRAELQSIKASKGFINDDVMKENGYARVINDDGTFAGFWKDGKMVPADEYLSAAGVTSVVRFTPAAKGFFNSQP